MTVEKRLKNDFWIIGGCFEKATGQEIPSFDGNDLEESQSYSCVNPIYYDLQDEDDGEDIMKEQYKVMEKLNYSSCSEEISEFHGNKDEVIQKFIELLK